MSKIDVAVTVIDSTVAFAGIVNFPLSEIFTPSVSALESTVHATALLAKPTVATVAVSSIDCPFVTVAVEGETLTDETAGVTDVKTQAFANGDVEITSCPV